MVKIPNPLLSICETLATPKGDVRTNPLRPLWLGGHPSGGGGTAPRGRLIEDDRQLFECERWREESRGSPIMKR
jgi:hypothetical protein